MEALTYSAVLADKATDIIPALSVIMEDEIDGLTIFATFILGSIVADGKIDESEYLLMKPLLEDFFRNTY